MPYPSHLIRSIAARHGVSGEPELMPDGGMVNEAWRIGAHVLRIVKERGHKECDDEAKREAAVVPAVVAAGIRTPKLVAWGLADELAPRPYTIYEHVDAKLVGHSELSPDRFKGLYFELGRDLAKLHRVEVTAEMRNTFTRDDDHDPAASVNKAVEAGVFPKETEAEVLRWIAFLKERSGATTKCMMHNDVHPWNLMFDSADCSLAAIIDWGDTHFADPAGDFATMPIASLPEILRGYTDEVGTVDDGFMARAMHIGLVGRFWELRKLDPESFDRKWWALAPGGWEEHKSLIKQHFPDLAVWD